MASSYQSPRRPLLHIDLNQQIIDPDDVLMESPKPTALTLSQSFTYSSSSSSSPSQLLCPMSINLSHGEDRSEQKELVAQHLKPGKESNLTGERFEMFNLTESPKLTSYNRIKLSFGRQKDASARDCTTEFPAKQKRSTRKNLSGETLELADHLADYDDSGFQVVNTSKDGFDKVCSDCNATRTPLWRSGPRGPKSLCNACGIRQRKMRRAMEAPESAVVGSGRSASTNVEKKKKMDKKEKRAAEAIPVKKINNFKGKGRRGKNRDMNEGMFPREEEDAAFLLMALSYGLVVDSGRSR